MLVIGMTGLMGSGKSTASSILVRKFGFVEMKFAHGLKSMLRALGLTDKEIEGSLKEVPNPMLCGKTPRHAMQTLGNEWGRCFIGEYFWVNLALDSAKKSGLQRIVFSDCRYPNEAEGLRQLFDGYIWNIVRPECAVSGHSSEQGQDQIVPDLVIDNSGTLDELEERISMAMLHLTGQPHFKA